MSYHKIAVLNGHFQPVRAVRLNPTSRGVLFGWGVYTTVRIYDGRPFNVESHTSRLRKDSSKAGIPLPAGFDTLGADLLDLAKRNGATDAIGRVMLLAGVEGGGADASNILVLTADRPERPDAESLWVAPYRLHTQHPLLGVKVICNGLYIQARREAKRNKFDEALVTNEREELVEVSSGNIFWVRDGALFTPSLECGCLDGSSRSLILKVADERGLTVHEGGFRLEDLLQADEVFTSSVSREVQPVGMVGGRSWDPAGGPVSAGLKAAFRARVGEWLAEAAAEDERAAEATVDDAARTAVDDGEESEA